MEADTDPNIRWVKIEWVDFGLDENQILAWMDLFGERAGKLSEDIHPHSDSEPDIICTGTYFIKMRLNKDIPPTTPEVGQEDSGLPRGSSKALQQLLWASPQKELQNQISTVDTTCPEVHGKTP